MMYKSITLFYGVTAVRADSASKHPRNWLMCSFLATKEKLTTAQFVRMQVLWLLVGIPLPLGMGRFKPPLSAILCRFPFEEVCF